MESHRLSLLSEIRESTHADLTGLFQAHMAKMDAQEAQRNAEFAQQGRRFKALQHQFSLLQLEVQAHTTPIPNPLLTARDTLDGPEDEDAVSVILKSPNLRSYLSLMMLSIFLITFERMAAVFWWPKEDWAFHLIPLLTG